MKKKVAVYIRVSSIKQAETGQGEKVQKDNCLDIIKRNNWEFYKFYFNPKGISGDTKVKERTEFMELMEDAKNKKFNIFLVNSLDRLGRKNKVMTKGLDMLFEAGINVYVGSTRIENTLYGRLISGITGEISQYDKEQILLRMHQGLEKATEQRGEKQGKVPYGYKRIGKSKNTKIEINDSEAEVIKFVYEKRIKEKMTLQKIAELLNEKGIKASRSPTWSHKKVHRILSENSREIYCGGMRNGWNEFGVCWPQILPEEYKIVEKEEVDKEDEIKDLSQLPKMKTKQPLDNSLDNSLDNFSSDIVQTKKNSKLIPILNSPEFKDNENKKNKSKLIPL